MYRRGSGVNPGPPIGGGRIPEGAPFLAQVGAKSYRGAPIFASWRWGWKLKILGLADLVLSDFSGGRHHLSGGAEGRSGGAHAPLCPPPGSAPELLNS